MLVPIASPPRSPSGCATRAKTAFEIISFNPQASDQPLVCYSRRIRVAGARGAKTGSLALVIEFSRIFGLVEPPSRMLKPGTPIHAFVGAGILPAQLPGIT
jgi:hypothetical protein